MIRSRLHTSSLWLFKNRDAVRGHILGVSGRREPTSTAEQTLAGADGIVYVLGLSYGAVEDETSALGCGVSKTTAYNDVQAAGVAAREKQRHDAEECGKRAVIGVDGRYVKVRGTSVGIEMIVDDKSGAHAAVDS